MAEIDKIYPTIHFNTDREDFHNLEAKFLFEEGCKIFAYALKIMNSNQKSALIDEAKTMNRTVRMKVNGKREKRVLNMSELFKKW